LVQLNGLYQNARQYSRFVFKSRLQFQQVQSLILKTVKNKGPVQMSITAIKNITKRLFYVGTTVAVVAFSLATNVSANCHVISANGSGNLSGTDWGNACKGFSGNCAGGAMVHGDTYFVAGGSGGGYNSSSTSAPIVDVSSTGTGTAQVLTIKAATVADHCSATGWNQSTMAVDGGAGQAIFAAAYVSAFEFSTPNVTLDGNFAATDTSSSWGNPVHACSGTQCGIKIDFSAPSAYALSASFLWPMFAKKGANNLTIRATEFSGCYTSCGSQGMTTDAFHGDISSPPPSNSSITHNYWHDSSQGYVATEGSTGTSVTYNYFLRNYSSATAPAVHGYTWAIQGGSNLTFAFNAVQDQQGTAVIDEVNSTCCNTTSNLQFYGNVIWTSNGNGSKNGGFGNGIVSCTNGDSCPGWVVYNNTIANGTFNLSNSLSFGNGNPGEGSSITEANNLFWNATPASNGVSCRANSICSTDYDYFGSTTHTPQSHEQVTTLNPFTNWMSGNFHLTADTNAGASLSSPFNVDPDGNTRTTWTRGAFQFVSGTSATVASPTSLAATVQ
jgi:hypothetical protein